MTAIESDTRPHDRQLATLRRRGARIVFLWGGAVSALAYAFLTLLDRSPNLDAHLNATAWTMLFGYVALRAWLFERRRRTRR